MADTYTLHERSVYGIFDLFGEYGGVQSIIYFITAFFLSPLSEHSFYMRAIEKMYIGRTKSKRVFTDSPPQEDFEEFEAQLSPKEKK